MESTEKATTPSLTEDEEQPEKAEEERSEKEEKGEGLAPVSINMFLQSLLVMVCSTLVPY